MGTIVNQVIDNLQAAGIRADEAYPGGKIPALAGPVAAVRLGKVDRSQRVTAVQVVILCPSQSGGSRCEAIALQAVDALEDMGGNCVKELCKFDEMADVFYVEITAEFFGSARADGWSAGPGYGVSMGTQTLEHVVSFVASRKTDDEVTDISQAQWEFTVEELLPPGYSETGDPQEPFSLTVTRGSKTETFRNCKLTAVKRQNTIRGTGVTRSGMASSRTAGSQ